MISADVLASQDRTRIDDFFGAILYHIHIIGIIIIVSGPSLVAVPVFVASSQAQSSQGH